MKQSTFTLSCLAVLALITVGLSSCNSIGSALTGESIRYTEVVGPSLKPVKIASSDLAKAELYPDRIHGLYDAGGLATAIGEGVAKVTSSSK